MPRFDSNQTGDFPLLECINDALKMQANLRMYYTSSMNSHNPFPYRNFHNTNTSTWVIKRDKTSRLFQILSLWKNDYVSFLMNFTILEIIFKEKIKGSTVGDLKCNIGNLTKVKIVGDHFNEILNNWSLPLPHGWVPTGIFNRSRWYIRNLEYLFIKSIHLQIQLLLTSCPPQDLYIH